MATTGGIPGLKLRPVSEKYGVPVSILWGVYGIETDFGHNISTSSAGARGAFQFIESTARSYNYPYVNSTNPAVVQRQMEVAAQYLSDLHKQYGSWDVALKHYSGGAYGLADVEAKSRANPPPSRESPSVFEVLNPFASHTIEQNAEEIEKKAKKPLEWTKELAEVLSFIGSSEGWFRVIKVVGGSILILVAFIELAKVGSGGELTKVGPNAVNAGNIALDAIDPAMMPKAPVPKVPTPS